MKYVIIWYLMNFNDSTAEGPYLDSWKEYTAVECTQAVLKKGPQIPKDGKIKVFQCVEKGKVPGVV